MRTFKCRKLGCTGVTAAVCIKRQWAVGMLHALYPECAHGCDQGLEVAKRHPALVPSGKRPGCAQSTVCAVCGDKFPPLIKDQRTCSRTCGDVTGRRTREIKRQARFAAVPA